MDGKDFTKALEDFEIEHLKPYALRSRERRETLKEKFREHPTYEPLEYRTEYHRDRDRILWSTAFKRLQHKTQIFPHYVEDHYRRRLTHSLEVSQVATTLARALGLNEIATEAIALAHDVGHTPFGHGGETALDKELGKVARKAKADPLKTQVPIYAFNHCVQGVEEVSRLSHEYTTQSKASKSHPGLNLSFDVRDGILKHIFSSTRPGSPPLANLANIVKMDQYKQYGNNCGSLEAQCVWFADKLSYLLGDIEDALRSQVFTFQEIQKCPFINDIWK